VVEGGHERAAGKGGKGAGCMRETDKMQHYSGHWFHSRLADIIY